MAEGRKSLSIVESATIRLLKAGILQFLIFVRLQMDIDPLYIGGAYVIEIKMQTAVAIHSVKKTLR